LNDAKVTVAITPNGFADAVTNDKFVMPHETKMSMDEFLGIMEHPEATRGVHYIQKQNSNLQDEFSELFKDISELPWASEAFGKTPDAVNFWMGDSRAVTSTHKDPYENIYAVIRGYKDITLFPPTDAPWLCYANFQQAIYNANFEVQVLEKEPLVPWIEVDPNNPNFEKFPDFANASPLKLRLNAGDVLYLPSLWFHHLKQSHSCVAVNFWYDMEFDCKFTYFNFLQSINKLRCHC
jgi:jumonji domain-containing protein 7